MRMPAATFARLAARVCRSIAGDTRCHVNRTTWRPRSRCGVGGISGSAGRSDQPSRSLGNTVTEPYVSDEPETFGKLPGCKHPRASRSSLEQVSSCWRRWPLACSSACLIGRRLRRHRRRLSPTPRLQPPPVLHPRRSPRPRRASRPPPRRRLRLRPRNRRPSRPPPHRRLARFTSRATCLRPACSSIASISARRQ
jgi:hypothetical protein